MKRYFVYLMVYSIGGFVLERIINLFPEERRPQLLLALSQNMRAIVSQRLVPTVEGKRCAAVEVLTGTKTVQELILKGRLEEIKEIMQKSEPSRSTLQAP